MRGTALCAAIEARNCDIAKYLIEAGCDINASDFDGEPPLFLALRKEKSMAISLRSAALDIAKLLIRNKKCHLNKVDPLTKKSAIHFATEQGMEEVVDWLIEANCDINKMDANGNTSLHLAVHNGYFSITEKLASNPRCLIKVYNSAGQVPIHIPCNNGNLMCLQVLIEQLKLKQRGRNPLGDSERDLDKKSELYINVNAETKFEKDTCLHIAVRNYYKDITDVLIKNGANVHAKNNLGQQPLVLACSTNEFWANKDSSVPEIILKSGANPNINGVIRNRYLPRDTQVTPLIVAAITENLEFAKMLVKKGADVNLCDQLGQTPIYHALWNNSKHLARFLLMDCPGINVNLMTHEGKSCLHAILKCSKNKPGELAELVKAIFRTGGQLPSDNSPLIEAVSYESVEVLDAILEESDVNLEEVIFDKDEGFNLLHTSVGLGNLDLVRVLLSHGDNIDRMTYLRESPFRVALKTEMVEAAEFLLNNGCNLTQEKPIIDAILASSKNKPQKLAGHKTIDSSLNPGDDSASVESLNSESESDDEDLNFVDDMFFGPAIDELDCIFHHKQFVSYLNDYVSSPRNLKLMCLMAIRNYFRENAMPFRNFKDLPIAEPLKLAIRYKNT